jgi:hypothetical protein
MATTDNVSGAQFGETKAPTKLDIKGGVKPEVTAGHVKNALASYDAASPNALKGGMRFYPQAHRAAVTVAKGEAPGIIPEGKADTPAIKRGVYRPPGLSDDAVHTAAVKIAILSPATPAGMSWKMNPQAAHEVSQLSPEGAAAAHQNRADVQTGANARGTLKTLKTGGAPAGQIKEAQGAVNASKAASDVSSAAVRGHLQAEGLSALTHASGGSISRAVDMHTGAASAADWQSSHKVKTGAFAENITDPAHSQRSTIDAHSADILEGQRRSFKFDRGLSSVGRYGALEGANAEAAKQRGVQPHQMQAVGWVADEEARSQAGSQATGGGRAGGVGGKRAGTRPVGQTAPAPSTTPPTARSSPRAPNTPSSPLKGSQGV